MGRKSGGKKPKGSFLIPSGSAYSEGLERDRKKYGSVGRGPGAGKISKTAGGLPSINVLLGSRKNTNQRVPESSVEDVVQEVEVDSDSVDDQNTQYSPPNSGLVYTPLKLIIGEDRTNRLYVWFHDNIGGGSY